MKVSRHSVCEKCCVSPKVWSLQATNSAGRLYWSRRLPFVSVAESDCTSPPSARFVSRLRKVCSQLNCCCLASHCWTMTRLLFWIFNFKFLGSVALSETEIEFSEYVFALLPASRLLRTGFIGSISTVSFDEHCSVEYVSSLLIVNIFFCYGVSNVSQPIPNKTPNFCDYLTEDKELWLICLQWQTGLNSFFNRRISLIDLSLVDAKMSSADLRDIFYAATQ